MLRRIAVTLATVAAAGFVAAAPAAADGWEGGRVGGSYTQLKGNHAGVEYLNLGGPYGITYANKEKSHFELEHGYFHTQSLYGR